MRGKNFWCQSSNTGASGSIRKLCRILRVNFMSDSISGSFKEGGLTIHILLKTDRQWLEVVLVNFLESSCPNICVIGPDVIQHCEQCIICTTIISTIPHKSRRWRGFISYHYNLICLYFFITFIHIFTSFKFSLFSWFERYTAFCCNKTMLNICCFDLICSFISNLFPPFLVNNLPRCICYNRKEGQWAFDRPFQLVEAHSLSPSI